MVATVRKGILASDAASFAAAARMVAKADLNARLAQIHCPTLALVGAQDALTPPELVQAHLNLDQQTMAALSKEKPIIVRSLG